MAAMGTPFFKKRSPMAVIVYDTGRDGTVQLPPIRAAAHRRHPLVSEQRRTEHVVVAMFRVALGGVGGSKRGRQGGLVNLAQIW